MECIFHQSNHVNCNGSTDNLKLISKTRLDSIIEKSKIREDSLHQQLMELSNQEQELLKCHTNCVSTYTSKTHLKRWLDRHPKENSSQEDSSPKRVKRSEVTIFDWKQHCLFCGDSCEVTPERKNPGRHRPAYECHTSERPGRLSFKDSILKVIIHVCIYACNLILQFRYDEGE